MRLFSSNTYNRQIEKWSAKQEDIYHRRPVVKRNISWIFSVYINFSRRPLYCWRNWFMSWEIIWHRKLISFIWWSLEIMKLWYTNWKFRFFRGMWYAWKSASTINSFRFHSVIIDDYKLSSNRSDDCISNLIELIVVRRKLFFYVCNKMLVPTSTTGKCCFSFDNFFLLRRGGKSIWLLVTNVHLL